MKFLVDADNFISFSSSFIAESDKAARNLLFQTLRFSLLNDE